MNEKNSNKLILKASEIDARDAKEADALGFTARILIQCTLPHSKPLSNKLIRQNGSFTLSILASEEIGLPYGIIPRLLIAWVTTETVYTKKRELVLGDSLTKFMRHLDMIPTGGRWGTIYRLKNQMQRLFMSEICYTYNNDQNLSLKKIQPVTHINGWWNPKSPAQMSFFESTLILNEEFFKEIVNCPIPIDMGAIKALKKSPMALDIYCWLTYKMSYLKKKTIIPWGVLETQFGSDYKLTRQFKNKFLHQLRTVSIVYPEARIEDDAIGLILLPSKPHIPLLIK